MSVTFLEVASHSDGIPTPPLERVVHSCHLVGETASLEVISPRALRSRERLDDASSSSSRCDLAQRTRRVAGPCLEAPPGWVGVPAPGQASRCRRRRSGCPRRRARRRRALGTRARARGPGWRRGAFVSPCFRSSLTLWFHELLRCVTGHTLLDVGKSLRSSLVSSFLARLDGVRPSSSRGDLAQPTQAVRRDSAAPSGDVVPPWRERASGASATPSRRRS